MGKNTKIGWTHHSFNVWWGCTKISPACTNCYASVMDKRIGGDHWKVDGPRRFFGAKHRKEPMKWNKAAAAAGERHRVFCSSMADVFEIHPDPAINAQMDEERYQLWNLILSTPNLDWLLLTKRPENMEKMLPWGKYGHGPTEWKNVWLGCTVENQEYADLRIPILLGTPAAVRFLSMEPLLGPVDLTSIGTHRGQPLSALEEVVGHVERPALDWIIVGGESGPKRRPTSVEWIRSLRDQCATAGKAFYLKQAMLMLQFDRRNQPLTFGPGSIGTRDVVELPYLDGVQHAAYPQVFA